MLNTLAEANAEDCAADHGLVCPDCGEQMEIFDDCSWPTAPPPVRVFCEACGFAALRSRYLPARPVPPGRTIANELEARGWDQRHLAVIMGCAEDVVSEIITGEREITPKMACKLAVAFGTSVEFWVNLEANYRQRISGQVC